MSNAADIELARNIARAMELAPDDPPPRILKQGKSARGSRAVVEVGGERFHVRLIGRGPAARRAFQLEAIALQTLPELSAGIAPPLRALDMEQGIIVTEDVEAICGVGSSLEELLVACGPDLGSRFDALGAAMAQLSAPAPKLVSVWRERAKSMQLEDAPALKECELWHASLPRLESLCRDLGVSVDEELARAAEALFPAWTGTRLIVGLTQGDPAPSNNFIGTRQARLLDFEYLLPRHPLFDLAQWSVRCPLPLDWFVRLVAQFEKTHCGPRSYFADMEEMLSELERVRAVSALYMLLWLPGPALIDTDASWVGAWTTRGAAIHAAEALHASASSQPDLSVLSALGFKLARAMRSRWPDAVSEIDFQHYGDYVPQT